MHIPLVLKRSLGFLKVYREGTARKLNTQSDPSFQNQKIVIALKKRLDSLEISTERYHQRMAAQAARELGLPLPPCSDLAEGRIRLKRMVDALKKLPLGMKDPSANAIVEEFTNWVQSEHKRQEVINGQ